MERRELETVIYEKDGPIARIILNRPEKANSQNSAMVWDVENSLKDAEGDYGIKVVLVKANGNGFCAGHDVGGGGGPTFPEFAEAMAAGHPWGGPATLFMWPVLHLWEFQKPTVAAVHGYCVGGGTYFALLNDIVVAAEDAYFQMPLPQGLGFPGGETMIEPWVMMNFHQAYEYLYLSQTLDAHEAHRLGMVNRVVPRDQLDDTVELIALQIAQAPLSVLMGIKAGVKRGVGGHGDAGAHPVTSPGDGVRRPQWGRRRVAAREHGQGIRHVAPAGRRQASRGRGRSAPRAIGLGGCAVTLIRSDEPGREWVKVGRDDGATRIWIAGGGPMPEGQTVGLHRHGGDEIFQVLAGTVRFHVDGKNIDIGAGHFVVVPPFTEHGFRVLTADARMQFVGEIEMGEWLTVIDPDGSHRQVEIRSTMMPWHRRPFEGEELDFAAMLAMMQTTNHLFDDDSTDREHHAH